MADPRPYPGAPRWVRMSWIIGGVLTLLVVVLIHAGGGPNHHTPSSDAGGQTLPSSATEHGGRQP